MIDPYLLQEARKAHRNRDYHSARELYQQIAYSYNDFTELEKEAFTKEVSDFAGSDPMYQEILKLVISHIIQANEPVLQSQLTKVIKEGYGERGAELLRYVLYYADYRDELKRIKKGRSYELHLPHQISSKTPYLEPTKPLKITQTQIYFDGKIIYTPSKDELKQIHNIDDYAELQRRATAFKKDNINLSLACLYKAKQVGDIGFPMLQNILRLPLFLQQAGKFEEAKSELQSIFNNADEYANNMVENYSGNKKLYSQYTKANYLEYLFDKARLIYKREKLLSEAEQFQTMSLTFREERIKLRARIDRESDIELKEYQLEVQEIRENLKLEKEQQHKPEVNSQEKIFKSKEDVIHFFVGITFIAFVCWLILG